MKSQEELEMYNKVLNNERTYLINQIITTIDCNKNYISPISKKHIRFTSGFRNTDDILVFYTEIKALKQSAKELGLTMQYEGIEYDKYLIALQLNIKLNKVEKKLSALKVLKNQTLDYYSNLKWLNIYEKEFDDIIL
jgi:hypothetical protein